MKLIKPGRVYQSNVGYCRFDKPFKVLTKDRSMVPVWRIMSGSEHKTVVLASSIRELSPFEAAYYRKELSHAFDYEVVG